MVKNNTPTGVVTLHSIENELGFYLRYKLFVGLSLEVILSSIAKKEMFNTSLLAGLVSLPQFLNIFIQH